MGLSSVGRGGATPLLALLGGGAGDPGDILGEGAISSDGLGLRGDRLMVRGAVVPVIGGSGVGAGVSGMCGT